MHFGKKFIYCWKVEVASHGKRLEVLHLMVLCGGGGLASLNLLLSLFMRSKPRSAKFEQRWNDSIAGHLKKLTEEPRVADTPENFATANYVYSIFERSGLDAHYTDYEVLLTYPLSRSLSLYLPRGEALDLKLKEQPLESVPCTLNPKVIPTFHAYSPSGNISAQIVFANYGSNITEEYYPHSRWLPPSGVQQGSIYGEIGDSLTPRWPSVADAERLSLDDPRIKLPRIPFFPISAKDATFIMKSLDGALAPHWHGALDLAD
ncbi:hypothetical protein KI387_006873 [Taxus chinensis]|uniref:Uncharacterized protein n=1 Tax=Taxus chinensis TaxID=29808 RepID=A0AA38GRA3_TAXCH|nr:hypothetical protein KI387_006873 [Taxus chinensis]